MLLKIYFKGYKRKEADGVKYMMQYINRKKWMEKNMCRSI